MATHRVIYRSAITGRWVTASFAAQNPDTTVAEHVHPLRAVLARARARLTPTP